MKRAVALGLAASLLASGAAYAFWTTAGTGTGTARSASVLPITVTAGAPTARVYPGGTSDVAVTFSNPNPFVVRVGSLTLDTSRGTGGFAVDSGHSGCGLSVLSFAAQTNAGEGWAIPANGSLNADLAGSLSMTTAAANACQGASITVYLAATVDAFTSTKGTAGLISYWRLGTGPTAADNFTGTAGTALTSHTGAVATTWTVGAGTDPILSDANRLRRTGTGWALDTAAGVPGTDYAVEADVVVRSIESGDAAGVVARYGGAGFYSARWSGGAWRVIRTAGGTDTTLASAAATLTAGQSYRLRLDVAGTALALSVNGTRLVTATDGTYAAAGRAGVLLGASGSTVPTGDATGLHADNFRVYANSGAAIDSQGGNSGVYLSSVVQNEPGALAGDLNGAVTLDGVGGGMRVVSPAALPTGAAARSVELWFRRTGTGDATLFAYGTQSSGRLFELRLTSATNLRFNGFALTRDFTLPGSTSDGSWHHVVLTYDGGAVQAYLDGSSLGAQSAVLNTAVDAYGFGAGISLATGSTPFGGSLDELAVYGQALTAATVRDHYRVGKGS